MENLEMDRSLSRACCAALALLLLTMSNSPIPGQKPAKKVVIPHGQDRLPGPALSPEEAIKKMTVPDGFSVELVAAEPDIVNPVAMTFDERGRIWICESVEYPRRSAGPGKDRIKILEDADGDGSYEKVTIFADGLNIPSGIAVGHGGVWVSNAPDILFYKIGPDGKAAGKPEVVVTGFGRADTHELPNSFTWGPDGWLYGLNGVFNPSHVKHKGKEYKFTCAMFRIHPRTRDFEIFCEGTSNPWGIAFDTEGSAFVSACVIDHLWHLVETGYYHRQGGPYPPYTWKIESIVKHKHQKAAYCGLHFFDSDAYPPEYRERLYMGNIHGNCINSDELTRDGSTYFAKPRPDFLTANDPWFMPVAQRTGPDGCLYILDWYDRYHCYQDANRDPQGIDRLRGRLYRVRYKGTPRGEKFDLAKESDGKLIERLGSPSIYFRDIAQRLLTERLAGGQAAGALGGLVRLVFDESAPRKARMHGLWALVGAQQLSADTHLRLLRHKDAGFRAWGVRAAANRKQIHARIRDQVFDMAEDASPDVKLQVAIAATKLKGMDPFPMLFRVLADCGDDKLIPHIVWQNLHPLLEHRAHLFVLLLEHSRFRRSPNVARILPRVLERLTGDPKTDPATVATLLNKAAQASDPTVARLCLATLASRVQNGEIAGPQLAAVRERLQPIVSGLMAKDGDPQLQLDAAILAASFKDPAGLGAVRRAFGGTKVPIEARLRALDALVAARDPDLVPSLGEVLTSKAGSPQFRGQVLVALGRHDDPRIAEIVLQHFPKLEGDVKPKAIELLTQRTVWSKPLLGAIAAKKLSADVLNVNQVRRLLQSKDADLVKQVKAHWGTLREDRNPEREQVVVQMRDFLRKTKGDPVAGIKVFKNVCAQCHKIYGEGVEVGPDITGIGRADFEHLLSNVFDPSLVIGAGYQATIVATNNGQVLTGLLVEDNRQRVVLKTQGGKLETIPRGDIDEIHVSKVSMMPEQLETQLKPREIADLFAFLVLDRPPGDPKAKLIPGAPR
jgi:putative membrane-bound dehydrogenase-like protein